MLIGYDIVTIPLIVFDLPQTSPWLAMDWLTTVFWTIDMCNTFFIGYFTEECIVEMRLAFIARTYAKSWLSLDIVIVASDWVTQILQLLGEKSVDAFGVLRAGKTARLSRLLRMFRLIRVVKLLGV